MRRIVFIVVLILLNVLIYFLMIPYMQKCVDSHLAKADYYTIFILFIAIICFLVSFIRIISRKPNQTTYFLLFIGASLAFWLPKIFSLKCNGCSFA